MDLMANALLAAGASPAMVHSVAEAESFVELACALVVNVGTLSEDWIGSMKLGAIAARRLGKPWVLDPVGAGATPARTQLCLDLLALKPTVVRGNASEILALGDASGVGRTRGVDSTRPPTEALETACAIAEKTDGVVVISGAVDYVTDGIHTLTVDNGDRMLQNVTATGCSVTALIAAFVATGLNVGIKPIQAAAHAMAYFNVAAEVAIEGTSRMGPGTFRARLLDQLYLLDEESVTNRVRIAVLPS